MKNDEQKNINIKSASKWIPSLYLTEGIPYVIIINVSVLLYKRLGISNTDIAFWTSWIYLPWVIKPFWSPFVDILRTKRWWIIMMQISIGLALFLVSYFIPTTLFFKTTLIVFWLMAFASATHDIAADGFYMLSLSEKEQSFFVGIRSTFYRLALIIGQGVLVILAGYLEKKYGGENITHTHIAKAWSIVFCILSVFFVVISIYHILVLPKPLSDKKKNISSKEILSEFGKTLISFFQKKEIVLALAFMLLFRLSEAMITKLATPFMVDSKAVGGLGLDTEQVGFIYGTVGLLALTIGGIVGGFIMSIYGLKRLLFPMALAITVPNIVYVILAYFQPDNLLSINTMIGFEQFGYGFGFTAYMMYLIYFSQGENQTSHYALCTGFMALGMMLPSMVAGKLQSLVGYQMFFIIVVILIIPTLLLIPMMKIEDDFGKK